LKIECVINCVISTPGIILQGPCETWVGVFDPSLDDGDSRARDRIANHHLLRQWCGLRAGTSTSVGTFTCFSKTWV